MGSLRLVEKYDLAILPFRRFLLLGTECVVLCSSFNSLRVQAGDKNGEGGGGEVSLMFAQRGGRPSMESPLPARRAAQRGTRGGKGSRFKKIPGVIPCASLTPRHTFPPTPSHNLHIMVPQRAVRWEAGQAAPLYSGPRAVPRASAPRHHTFSHPLPPEKDAQLCQNYTSG